MIARLWHGYTLPQNAAAYETLLRTEVFPSIEQKQIKGYRKISLLKRPLGEEVEFITIMLFDDLVSIKNFMGEDYERSYVPEKARALLSRHDERSQHYEIIHEVRY
ncbi:MAG: hypothetical protein JNN04_17475 [Cyclobacteriaceae bacterium]|nr:hypothetical protein [Cyclobacteriaceae bacterium]